MVREQQGRQRGRGEGVPGAKDQVKGQRSRCSATTKELGVDGKDARRFLQMWLLLEVAERKIFVGREMIRFELQCGGRERQRV
jgi:hypothetical protein